MLYKVLWRPMLYLTKLKLTNYCGYINHEFDFLRKDGTPYPFICFFGPNGIGKSNLLGAISLLTSNQANRNEESLKTALRKYVFNVDYLPTYERLKDFKIKQQFAEEINPGNKMLIEGTFSTSNKDYIVSLTQNGFTRNDLAPLNNINSGPWGDEHLKYRQRIVHSLTADNDLSRNTFQLHYDKINQFIPLLQEVFRYPVECPEPKGMSSADRGYCLDVVITKTKKQCPDQEIKTHFKNMSDGEQKICKSFSQVLNLMHDLECPMAGDEPMVGWPRIIIIDNIEMHVYYDRHVTFVDCLKKEFNKQQIFATTHSGILIPRYLRKENDQENELWIDLEPINN